MTNKVLTKAEEQVMKVIWDLENAGLREVVEAMPEPKPHHNTVATILKILADKGFVSIETTRRVSVYSPAIARDQYSIQRIEQLAQSYFGGSLSNIISFLVKKESLSVSDLELLVNDIKKDQTEL